MMIKGAIFDLDGTVLDSMSIWDTVADDYLRSLGKVPKENLRETFASFSLEQSACYYREHYGVQLSVEEIIQGINDLMRQYYTGTVLLKPHVEELLDALASQGVRMCIATMTDRDLAEAALTRLSVRKYFSGIFSCSAGTSGKEQPDLFREALMHLGTRKSETIVFEDSLYALRTAKADGFLTAAVFDAHENRQAELKALADYYITDYADACALPHRHPAGKA